jgi:Tfp pilus assembly protein PilF
MKRIVTIIFLFDVAFIWSFSTIAQKAIVKEEIISIPTYPFSDPNPNPTLIRNPGIYPYHKFDGYSHVSKPVNWKVIKLENEYLTVTVLPEAGGKVWGAIEKSTGKDFIYQNNVMKFRNIAMRGPWTSGGIEFNFGIIGHTPATATPVDYCLENHPDGSVSCTVGMIDLPSRTQWRVKILLEPDKAYFTTKATWYNPTALTHPYYNWMTAAAKTTADLAFYYPGTLSLMHSGETTEWPVGKDGRHLWWYKNNNFGPSKSYHVSGRYHNFFGGYWHNENIGFGHAGRFETMPGQKLWLWSLARDGGIWEDLLTDDNGQYMEFQSGRLFNQYFNDSYDNPITEMAFSPHLTDQWEERWFPVKGTGGMTTVTESTVFHMLKSEYGTEIRINALAPIDDTLHIFVDGIEIKELPFSLEPMATYMTHFSEEGNMHITIGNEIIYNSLVEENKDLKRPFQNHTPANLDSVQKHFLMGAELFKRRKYQQSKSKLEKCLVIQPDHMDAHVLLAKIYHRNGLFDSALVHTQCVLLIDTYDFDANYIAGLCYKAKKDLYNALDALAIAGRSMKFRSAAFTEIAQMELSELQLNATIRDAQYALEFNAKNISALQTLAIAHRLKGNLDKSKQVAQRILNIDPLNHFARFEISLINQSNNSYSDFKAGISNEFPYQSYLEIASVYLNVNQYDNAASILMLSPAHPLVDIWLAFVKSKINEDHEVDLARAFDAPAEFVFPYRQESIEILKWAATISDSWKIDYFLGLIFWSKNRLSEAAEHFQSCGSKPDIPSFYITRSTLMAQYTNTDKEADLKRAYELNEKDWRSHHEIIKYYQEKRRFENQLSQAEIAASYFPDNYVIGLDLAQALVNNQKYEQCLEILAHIRVLPSEGSFSGRKIYEKAVIFQSIDFIEKRKFKKAKEALSLCYLYPENIGSGRPFHPEERHLNFLMGMIEDKTTGNSETYYQKIVDYDLDKKNDKFEIFTLYGLEKLKDNDSLNSLIEKLKLSDDIASKWVLRHWTAKTDSLKIVKELFD